ncbi:hypothetical protein ACHAW5_003703 [Stephanodiscus triporus]|uniref:Calmodulin-lysine N-methyltransferase n=1 Tax=Stephanodiscus triporus TaxID=2934178 RepID=A0ABD3QQG4_9STRA
MQLSSSAVLPSLEELERRLTTSRRILMNRMICLGVSISSSSSSPDDVGRSGCRVRAENHDDDDDDDDSDGDAKLVISGGLSTVLLSLLEVAFESWSKLHDDRDSRDHAILLRTLALLSRAARSDPTLGEEIAKGRGRGGMTLAAVCSRLLERIDEHVADNGGGGECASSLVEDDADAFADLRDAVFEIYSPSSSSSSSSSSLPASCMPLTDDELRSRLPLLYHLTPAHRSRHREDGETGRERDRRGPLLWRHSTRRRKRVGDATTATTVFISQVTRRQCAQADVGFVMWPSAIVLSRYLVSNPHRLVVPPREEGRAVGRTTTPSPSVVLELGAGCGLVGITAARVILASRLGTDDDDYDDEEVEERRGETRPVVVITDVNEIVLDNIARNVELNDVSSIAYASRLDFYAQSGDCRAGGWVPGGTMGGGGGGSADGGGGGASEGRGLGQADVVLAADIICRPEDAIAASRTIYDALRPKGVALVVCANAEHRFGVEIFESECEKRGLAVTSTDVAEMYDRGLLEGDLMETAAGYVDGMRMTFFEITKIR